MSKACGSLFSGGGLADIGLMMAGYTPLFAVEHKAEIAEVYRANIGDHVHVGDVGLIDPNCLPYVDLLWASPPCQAYSVARSQSLAPRDDADVGLSILKYVEILEPKSVVIENVEGYGKSKVCQDICAGLMSLGYWVHSAIYNAADFGVPQSRRRLIIRAQKDNLLSELIPTHNVHNGWYAAVEDLIPTLKEVPLAPWQKARLPEHILQSVFVDVHNDRPASIAVVEQPTTTIGCSTASRPSHCLAILVDGSTADNGKTLPTKTDAQTVKAVCASQDHRVPKMLLMANANTKGNGFPLRETDEPSITVTQGECARLLIDGLTASNGTKLTIRDGEVPSVSVSVCASPSHCNSSRVVIAPKVLQMSPRCFARFQSVPDWYELPKNKALSATVIGNGVPCLFAKAIAESFN
jgi:DNA (cytosine-5)-methyltransferase 1